MSAGGILLWGVSLCLASIAGAGLYFELASLKRRKNPAAIYGFGRHPRPRRPKIKGRHNDF